MIHTNRIVTVGEQECIIDRPIVLYRGDREVEIEFTLVGNEFMFSEEGNVIKSVNASHGQLVLNTPSGEHMFSELAECHEGKVVFIVTKEMIDEFIEMGFYSFQIRLYDSAEMKSRVTIPPVMNGFDIRNPIAAEDEVNVVDQGLVDYARIVKDQTNEELPTFDWQDNYVKTEWAHHDVITENKMNKIEDALYSINANIKETDIRVFNTLDQVKKDADAYVKEHIAEVEADVAEFERNLNNDVQKFKIDTNAAVTTYKNEVSEELEGFSTQLEHIEDKINFSKIFLKSEDNTPTKINELLNKISGRENSSIDFFNYCGVLELGAGVFEVDEVIMRSNVTIKGQGIGKTIIKPTRKHEDDFLFKCVGTDSNNRLVNFELRDLSIMPNGEGQYALLPYENRFLRAGIDFRYTSSCRLENVIISGLKGCAIKCVEHYDSDFSKIQLLSCGDDERPGFQITVGDNDGCNAFRINNFRFEELSKVLVNDDKVKFMREIHFLGGKFEGTQLHLDSVSSVNITNTHFTWTKKDIPVVHLSKNSNGAEIYGIKFVACTFLTANNADSYGIYNENAQMTYFNSCTFKGFGKAIRGNNFNISNCDFYSCLTPVIDVGNFNTLIGNWFRSSRGTEKVGAFGSYNTVAFNNSNTQTSIDCFYVKGVENDIIWNGRNLPSTGDTNWHMSNNVQLSNSFKMPHNTPTNIGNLKYDANTKTPYIYNGTNWDMVLNKQVEWQAPCNTTNLTDIQATLNGLITKLVSSGVMKNS